MNILYAGDKNIADGLIISVLSLIKHTSDPLNIYVLTMELPEKSVEKLEEELISRLDEKLKRANPENSAELIDVTPLFTEDKPSANIETRFTPACMLRLFADELETIPGRILYLDNDVVCMNDFSEFYHSDLSGAPVGGVLDRYGRWFFRKNPFKADYLNSGVLLLDMAEIRKSGLFKACRELLKSEELFMPDQSAINRLSSSKKIFPRKYNEQNKLHHDTVFRHFTTTFRFFPYIRTVTVKPWQKERLHKVLGVYELDELLGEWQEFKQIKTKEEITL